MFVNCEEPSREGDAYITSSHLEHDLLREAYPEFEK
jgi:hypothetical protein